MFAVLVANDLDGFVDGIPGVADFHRGVVDGDGMPPHSVRGDADFRDEGCARYDHSVVGRALSRDAPYELLHRVETELGEQCRQYVFCGAIVTGDRRPDPHLEAEVERDSYPVERTFCILAHHWGAHRGLRQPIGWHEASFLADRASAATTSPELVDTDVAWNAMRSRLVRDRWRHRITIFLASVVTIRIARRCSPSGDSPISSRSPKRAGADIGPVDVDEMNTAIKGWREQSVLLS
jgi:hypothetical protein